MVRKVTLTFREVKIKNATWLPASLGCKDVERTSQRG